MILATLPVSRTFTAPYLQLKDAIDEEASEPVGSPTQTREEQNPLEEVPGPSDCEALSY